MPTERRSGVDLESALHRRSGEIVLSRIRPVSLSDVAIKKKEEGGSLSLYVHIPFCTEICSFCAFHRRVGNGQKQEAYIDALEVHIEETLPLFDRNQKIRSLYIGGGTPGLLTPEQAERVFSRVKGAANTDRTQITYELHPNNITPEYIQALLDLGVGRFSVGVQNLSDAEREILGRTLTTGDEDIEKLQVLNDKGVEYNLDLMFGTPVQTEISFRDTLERITREVYPPEITLYQYVNAHGSETKKLITQGLIKKPGLGERRAMYNFARSFLIQMGYRQTNTQSFSRDKSTPDRVLLNQGGDFLGLGPKTYSRVGQYIFMNDSRTEDFKPGGNTTDYYGIKLPIGFIRLLDKGFAFFARQQGEITPSLPLPDLGILRSEMITQAYGILYYILNQPRMQTRLAEKNSQSTINSGAIKPLPEITASTSDIVNS